MKKLLLALAALLLPGAAQAEWREAQSTNFVIYADDSESDLARFAERLERYHAALELLTQTDLPPPSPSNRVTVFMVGNPREVSRLFGDGGENIAGFYSARAGYPTAFVPNVRSRGRATDFSVVVLLHEYAHHFILTNSAFPPPPWLNEGSAEFFASARFNDDGSLSIGLPAAHRYAELMNDNVDIALLLDPALLEQTRMPRWNSFYGKSWALFHYLNFSEERRGQLQQYLRAVARGEPHRAAAEAAFGDFSALEREVQSYIRRPQMLSMRFAAEALEAGPISIRVLRAGEAAAIDAQIRSRRGVDSERAAEVLAELRPVALAYPDDPAVLAALAEAEYDAGNSAEAIAAADRAIERDYRLVNPYIQKGYALFREAAEMEPGDARNAAFQAAVEPFLALNRLENDHPLPLYYFHRAYAESGEVPDIARDGLARAVELAPYDPTLRMALVQQRLRDGDLPQAAQALRPIAFAAHGGWLSEKAAEVLALIDAGAVPGDAESMIELLTSTQPEADASAEDG